MLYSRRTLLAGAGGLLLAPRVAAAPMLPTALERLDRGRLVPAPLASSTRRLLVYCGAGWCGPCRALLPRLRRAHARLATSRSDLAIVYAGDDADPRSHRDYVVRERMPWLLVRHDDPARVALRARGGAALPGLLLFDRAGTLLATSWHADGSSRPGRLLDALTGG